MDTEQAAGGRPSMYTADLALEICSRLADGDSLRLICAGAGFPTKTTVLRWVLEDREGFRAHYTRAREMQVEQFFDELLEIADDGTNDWMEIRDREGECKGWRENGEAIRRSALRIDTRKWAMSKLLPKKYGDKINVESTGDTMQRVLILDI